MSKRQFPDREAASFIAKHAIAFLLPDPKLVGGVRPVGSGSLVTFDQRYLILTATHVWAELQKSEDIYYSNIERTHKTRLHRDSLISVSLDDKLHRSFRSGKEVDPLDADLTLLELHPADRVNIDVRHSFFPVERQHPGVPSDCVIIGAPGVLAQQDDSEVSTLLFQVRGIFLEELRAEAELDGLDFWSGIPYQDPNCQIKDYRGMSGGGVWLVYYYPQKIGDERYEIFLTGVMFFQDDTEVRSLGRKAIEKLIEKFRDGRGRVRS
jgi:hypothetical protein